MEEVAGQVLLQLEKLGGNLRRDVVEVVVEVEVSNPPNAGEVIVGYHPAGQVKHLRWNVRVTELDGDGMRHVRGVAGTDSWRRTRKVTVW
jgi:hypothetical protein